ncbi:MAG: aspartate carbamoyltransferase regulatory subunit [Candidatus Diapherotrites archaeon]|nr:aspartate carbamoyltransferase regulatory subunit [Candidatus Diapherotrites archaeon]
MTLEVKPIQNGTVIDHIPAGKGLVVYTLLGGANNGQAVLLLNAKSPRLGRKDIVKMADVFVDKERRNIIALVAPEATINTIKNGKLVEKHNVEMPKRIEGYLKCLNPKCVTNAEREPLATSFTVSSNPLRLKCDYCDKEYSERLVSGI